MNSDLSGSVGFGVIAFLVLWISWRRGFFTFPEREWSFPIRFIHLLGAFATYFFISFAASLYFRSHLQNRMPNEYLGLTTWFNFTASGAIFCALLLYWKLLPRNISLRIWRREGAKQPYFEDAAFAFLAWFISFPLVLFVSDLMEYIVSTVFQVTQLPDQLAVKFLKLTFGQPVYLSLSVISILVFAPVLEELLFRGFLQSFIRQHLGPRHAIVITSVCFAFFHYSADQGLGNIPIIASLIALALFLGVLYERQGSLFSPIVLHASFNAISVLNLYFLGGFPGGI